MKRLLRIVLIVLLAPLLLTGIWALWERTRDPLAGIDRDITSFRVVSDSVYVITTLSGDRNYHDIILYSDELDTIRFTLSLPSDPVRGTIPTVMLIGGLEIGRQSLQFVGHQGNNALIAYEYPYGPEYWYEGTPLGEIPAIRSAVRSVPAQLAAIAHWARSQPWADRDRICTFSYSFGAIFVPAFYRVSEAHGDTLGPAALIYGGADIELLLGHNLQIDPGWLRGGFAWLATTAIYPIEPEHHFPYLHSEFLIVNGTRDQLIPQESARLFQEIAPEPKKVINLDTEHMHPKALELIARLVGIGRDWLLEQHAIEP